MNADRRQVVDIGARHLEDRGKLAFCVCCSLSKVGVRGEHFDGGWKHWKTCLMWQENTKRDSRGGSEPKCIWKDEVEREREYAIRSVLYVGSDG